MSYRIAGIDVHKKGASCSCVQRRNRRRVPVGAADVWHQPRPTALAGRMTARARGRRSSHGIDGPILETSVGGNGKVLEAIIREARRREAEVWNVAFGAGTIQSRTTGTQEGFSRCRTPGEAPGGPGIDFEFCARCRAASMTNGSAQEVPVEARPRAVAQPIGALISLS